MTNRQIKIAVGVGAAGLILWWLGRSANAASGTVAPTIVKPAGGDVILGTPTVTGPSAIQGGTDYATPADTLGMLIPITRDPNSKIIA